MPKDLVYLCQNKLLGINNVSPILLRIKSLYPAARLSVVFLSNTHRDQIRQNHEIWEAIHILNPRIYAMRGRNAFITILRILRFMADFSFKDIVFLKDGDVLPFHKAVMRILRRVSKIVEVKTYFTAQFPIYLKGIYTQLTLKREREKRNTDIRLFDEHFDYLITALSARDFKELANVEAPEKKLVRFGYTSRFPEWRKFIKECCEKNPVINGGPYFFYILHATYQRFPHYDEPDVIELIEESLGVMKKYSDKIRTVFKPHTITDMKKLKEVLDRTGYRNYVIDYSHPAVLSSKARFVFGNVFSSIMFDAYYMGIPTVEYCQYDAELFERLGRRSIGGDFVDFFIFRDKEKLDRVLNKLVSEDAKIERDPDFIKRNYPDTPQEFYDLWHKLLSK